jgi:S-adenosylmethionine:tRNA-ribosyltransferase-isomerase (queuine synthetase)
MKHSLKSSRRQVLTFGDLVFAVSSVSRNTDETAAAVTDLLESGRVRLTNNGRIIRARVS